DPLLCPVCALRRAKQGQATSSPQRKQGQPLLALRAGILATWFFTQGRSAIGEQPGAVALPGADEGLSITQSGHQQARSQAVMARRDACLYCLQPGHGQRQCQQTSDAEPGDRPEEG